jgi:sulfate transporter 4
MFGDFSINPSHPQDAYEAALQDRYNKAAVQVAFIAGFFYFAIGLFRLGWIVNFLGAPVMSGFMTGAASIIVASQLKYITGQYLLPRAESMYDCLKLVFDNMNLIRQPEMAMGFSFTAFLVICIVLGKRYKHCRFLLFSGPLIVTVISIIVMNAGDYYYYNPDLKYTPIIKDIGEIPSGMPDFTVGWWLPLYYPSKQVVLALIICLMDVAESTTVARALAQRNRYKLDFTQELRALGIANIAGAAFNCYTVTGAFSRSVVNEMAGAVTLMSSFVTGITIMIILLCLTPIFTHMSLNVQGAIVIVAVLPLFRFGDGLFYWRVDKLDFLSWLTAYIVTAFAGALPGLGAAIGLSFVIFILRAAFPRFNTVGVVSGTKGLYKPTDQFPQADVPTDGIAIIRPEAPLFFGNLPQLRDQIDEALSDAKIEGNPIRALILDVDPASQFDGAVASAIFDILLDLGDEHATLVLANPSQKIILTLQRANLIVEIGGENIQASMEDAVARAREIVATAEAKIEEGNASFSDKKTSESSGSSDLDVANNKTE